MESRERFLQRIRLIPRHAAGELSGGEWCLMALVALLALTPIVGTLATAWWLALR